jgi:hypothetical protein
MALTTDNSHDPKLTAVVYDMDILWLIMALADGAFYARYQMFDEKVFGQPVINAHGFTTSFQILLAPDSPNARSSLIFPFDNYCDSRSNVRQKFDGHVMRAQFTDWFLQFYLALVNDLACLTLKGFGDVSIRDGSIEFIFFSSLGLEGQSHL